MLVVIASDFCDSVGDAGSGLGARLMDGVRASCDFGRASTSLPDDGCAHASAGDVLIAFSIGGLAPGVLLLGLANGFKSSLLGKPATEGFIEPPPYKDLLRIGTAGLSGSLISGLISVIGFAEF